MQLQEIITHFGLSITRYEPVYGGDISRGYCLHTDGPKYFLKVNDAKKYPAMFEKEANGLDALLKNCPLRVPLVIKSGKTEEEQWLLLEWMEKGYPKTGLWQNFGTGLAILHQKQQPFFGWGTDNFIGSLVQSNQQQQAWNIFYLECRIMPLVKNLFNGGVFSRQDLKYAELFCKRIEQGFPVEPPAMLHGDLWSGNYMVTDTGYAAIFDPAVYCGHREMDIGMTKLFGGFDGQFYDAYNEAYPLEKGWRQRVPIAQLYPLLVHAVLFGGHYVESVREIMKESGI